MYNVFDISHYCLYYLEQKGDPISNLQLQKILYYIQGAFLCKLDVPCFEEDFVAWEYGMVLERVYNRYKYKSSSIITDVEPAIFEIAKEHQLLIDIICDIKCKRNAGTLLNLTMEETPWMTTNYKEVISKKKIMDYFKSNPERLYI